MSAKCGWATCGLPELPVWLVVQDGVPASALCCLRSLHDDSTKRAASPILTPQVGWRQSVVTGISLGSVNAVMYYT